MGMIVYKVKWHLGAVIKTALFKLTFGRNFSVGGGGGGTNKPTRFNVFLKNWEY